MVIEAKRCRPNRSISLAKQRRGQKVSSIIQSDIPGNTTDKDVRYKRTGGMEAKKYQR